MGAAQAMCRADSLQRYTMTHIQAVTLAAKEASPSPLILISCSRTVDIASSNIAIETATNLYFCVRSVRPSGRSRPVWTTSTGFKVVGKVSVYNTP